jgi:hypothetical protein
MGMALILAVFGILKSKWFAVIPVLPTIVWDLTHLSVIKKYFNISQVGNVKANIASPSSASHLHYGIWPHLGIIGQAAAPVLVGLLAVAALLSVRDRISAGLAMCAASTGVLLVAVHYGNEDIFRATLFAIPFLAVLAARSQWRLARVRASVIAVALPVMTGAFVFGDMGFDYIYYVRPSDLGVVQHFETYAPEYSTLLTISDPAYSPNDSVPRYTLFAFGNIDLPTLYGGGKGASAEKAAREVTQEVEQSVVGNYGKYGFDQNIYVASILQGAAEWAEGGLVPLSFYHQFSIDLSNQYEWKIAVKDSNSILLHFRTNNLARNGRAAVAVTPECHAVNATSTIAFKSKRDRFENYRLLALGTVTNDSASKLKNVVVTWTATYADLTTTSPQTTLVTGSNITANGQAGWGELASSSEGKTPPVSVHVKSIETCPSLSLG